MGNTVLIAEIFRPTLHMLTRLFEDSGFTVYQADTCQEAVKQASLHLPDCFVLDYQLADGPVPTVCAFIRSHETLKNAPIAIYSTYTDRMEDSFTTCRADVFVEKGKNPDALVAAIKHHLHRYERTEDAAKNTDLTLDPVNLRVLRHGEIIAMLSPEQYRLFSILFNSRPGYISDRELAAFVFSDLGNDRLDATFSLVHRLRRKLGPRYGRRIVCKKERGWAYIQPRLRA